MKCKVALTFKVVKMDFISKKSKSTIVNILKWIGFLRKLLSYLFGPFAHKLIRWRALSFWLLHFKFRYVRLGCPWKTGISIVIRFGWGSLHRCLLLHWWRFPL